MGILKTALIRYPRAGVKSAVNRLRFRFRGLPGLTAGQRILSKKVAQQEPSISAGKISYLNEVRLTPIRIRKICRDTKHSLVPTLNRRQIAQLTFLWSGKPEGQFRALLRQMHEEENQTAG